MTKQEQYLIAMLAISGIVILFLGSGNPIEGAAAVVNGADILAGYAMNVVGRGNRVSYGTMVNDIVQEIPDVLIDQAEAVLGFRPDSDTYSLARMGRSEGVDGMEYRMHVALNDLAELQATYGTGVYSSLTALMIHSKVTAANGHYSEQYLGKRYATEDDPYESDIQLAIKVIQDHANGIDPSGGAVKFVDKNSFGVQKGTENVTYDQKVAQWAQQGLSPVTGLPGASDNFVVFVRA